MNHQNANAPTPTHMTASPLSHQVLNPKGRQHLTEKMAHPNELNLLEALASVLSIGLLSRAVEVYGEVALPDASEKEFSVGLADLAVFAASRALSELDFTLALYHDGEGQCQFVESMQLAGERRLQSAPHLLSGGAAQ